jgi:hypothetical protein
LVGHEIALGEQIVATILIDLPQTLNGTLLCQTCVEWPHHHTSAHLGQIAQEVALRGSQSLAVIALWAVTLWGVWPPRWRAAHAAAMSPEQSSAYVASSPALQLNHQSPSRLERLDRLWAALTLTLDDVRWWGYVLMLLGSALVLVEYIVNGVSYTAPGTSARYLLGLLLFTPLVVTPLVAWMQGVSGRWPWQLRHQEQHERQEQRTPRQLVPRLALIALIALNGVGVVVIQAAPNDQTRYGIPAGSNDQAIIQLLLERHAPRFYTTYWLCDRLMFESQQQLTCGVISTHNARLPGLNRVANDYSLLQHTTHPAYVLDLSDSTTSPTLPSQVEALIGGPIISGDTAIPGYHVVAIAQYRIYYYVAPSP